MKIPMLVVGVVALFSIRAASATTYFDTITGIPSVGADSPSTIGDTNGNTVALASFTAGSPDFSSISLVVADSTPGDGGSLMIFLVPDDGSGSPGVAGKPTINVDNSGNYVSLANAQYVGAIADSSLGSVFSAQSLFVSPTITTPNDEYWVGVVWSGGSQAELSYEAGDAGVGTAGQAFDNTTFITQPSSDANGAYQVGVSTPEPATIALIGTGLGALGYARRRKATKAR